MSESNHGLWVSLGEIDDVPVEQTGPSGDFFYVDISSIDRDTKKILNAKTIAANEAPSRAKQVLQAGDIVVSMTRPNLNAVAQVPEHLDGAIGSTGFHILRSRWIKPAFLFYLVQTDGFIDAMCEVVQGALYPAVRPKDISSFKFFLQSPKQQTRIVEKLEELLSDLDAGVAELKAAQKKLGQYRQSLLKAAVEGALTAQWRAARAPLSPRGRGAGGEGAYLDTAAPDEAWLKQRAKELRREQTPFEYALWQQLRAKRFSGFKFRRQQALGRYIVDFVCFEKRLIIEADGGQHNASSRDGQRDAWLQQQGFRVLRIWNNDIAHELEAVLESIWQVLQQKPPLPNPSPARGEGLEPETGAQLLQRILCERRARWEAKQLAKFAEQGKTPSKDWQKKYPEPAQPDTSDLPELPEGWVWASVEQLGHVQLGRQRSPNKVGKMNPTPYIRAANITEDGVDLGDVLEMDFSEKEKETFALNVGDVLLTEASGSPEHVGRPAIWRHADGLYCFQNTVLRFSPNGIFSEYAFHLFLAMQKLGVFSKLAGGVGINHLSAGKFSKLPVPLPPVAEQLVLIDVIQQKLSLCDEQLTLIEKSLTQSTAQRKNILKAAFSGQLVPQDPNDEPASILLARIRAERAVRDAVKKPRGRKAKETS